MININITNPETKTPWTLDEAVVLARRLEFAAIPLNAHVALGGSVLHRGQSEKDVDIFVYPHKKANPIDPHVILRAFGAKKYSQCFGHLYKDGKTVFYAEIEDRRVDIFFVQ